MYQFVNVLPPNEGLGVLLSRLDNSIQGETVPTALAAGSVTAEEVVSLKDLPAYPRSIKAATPCRRLA